MSDSDTAALLKAEVGGARKAVDEHPRPEELVAYRAGLLDSQVERGVRDHLVACEECSELLLELADLEDHGPTVTDLSEHELERAWRAQRDRLFPPAAPGWASLVQRAGWAAAACLGLVVAALGFEVRELKRDRGFWYEDLPRVIAAERSIRSQSRAVPILVPEAGRPSIVLLLVDGDLDFDSYRIELFGADDRAILTRDRLSVSEDLLLVVVPPDLLSEGPIRVTVAGLRNGRYVPVEEYDLRVEQR